MGGMKALILVGGYGTRLRPLTLTQPKPLVELGNQALMVHQIKALAKVGVTDVVLAIAYKPSALKEYLDPLAAQLGVNLIYSCEDEANPMGTAGPLGLARKYLVAKEGEEKKPFFVFNSDVICDFPLTELLALHKARGAEGTLLVKQVEEPSKYGVIVFDEKTGKIARFVEKPKDWVGDKINAGMYCLEESVLDYIEPRRMSIEREVFPKMAEKGRLYAFTLTGFWADVGQPRDFLAGTNMYLASLEASQKSGQVPAGQPALRKGADVIGAVLVDPSATIGAGCVLGPNVVVGPGCKVGNGVRLSNTTLLANSIVKDGAFIQGSIIGWKSSIGRWSRVEGLTVLAENVKVADELHLNGALVLPHKEIGASIPTPQIVM